MSWLNFIISRIKRISYKLSDRKIKFTNKEKKNTGFGLLTYNTKNYKTVD